MAIHWSQRFQIVPAVYVLVEQDGKLLLLRRANTGYLDGFYTTPSGHLDGGEPPSVAAARELHEEAGLHAAASDLRLVHCVVYTSTERDHERVSFFFKATKYTGQAVNAEPDKSDDLRWAAYDDLPENMVWELSHALEQIAAGNLYSETNYSAA